MRALVAVVLLLPALALGQGVEAERPLRVMDEGATKGWVWSLDFTGAGVTCTAASGKATCSVSAGGGGGAPTTATYVTQTPDATLSAEQALSLLSTGLLKVTTGTGVLATAVAADVPTPVASASALAANPANCSAGQAPLGVDAAGAVEGCFTPAGTYTLPDATGAVTGGVRLTGDLGGTATSPSVVDDSHAHTTSTVSGLDAGVDFTAGVLPGARGGGGAALPTCAGTDKLTANGTSWSCATDQTAAGGGYAIVQDEGSGLTARTTLNFAGAGVSCADDTTRTTCTISGGGGGGSPGGSSGQVQYNDGAGGFAGASGVTIDTGNLVVAGSTSEPAAPASGSLKLYGMQPHGSNGPVLPFWKGGTTQVDYRLFPEMRSADPWWGCAQPAAHNSTTITVSGAKAAGSATGTAAAVAWASTDERTRAKWVQYPSATTASSSAGLRANLDYVWRGNAAGLGGWYWWGSFNVVTTTANQRLFVGLKDATAVITATVNPSTALDAVGFQCDAGETTIRIGSNDNTGSATRTDLGASFPCTTANVAYDVALWAQPNGGSIGYYIRRLVDGSEAQGTLSTDLPRNTVQLGWDFWINNGGTAAASTIQFGGTCYIGNP